MAIKKDANYMCPACFNLDFDRLTKYNPRCILDEYRIVTQFPKLKASAKSGDCLACEIILAGLEHTQEQWDRSELLLDDTLLLMNLSRGYSLRVTLDNLGYEFTVEFYCLSHEGIHIFLSIDGAC